MADKYLNVHEQSPLDPSSSWRRDADSTEPAPDVKILHTITGVSMGGAEMMLYRLLARCDRDRFAPAVLSLLSPGQIGERIRAMGIPIMTLGMRQDRPLSPAMFRLVRAARSVRPTLIQGWMYHGNLAASLSALLSGSRLPVIWNVRHSIHDLDRETTLTRGFIRLAAALSWSPRAIIYNSRLSADQHERIGFAAARTVVIPNGFDCNQFRPRPEMRQRLCAEVGIDGSAVIIGMVARNHPQKDPTNLVRAAALLLARGVKVHVVIVGPGFDGGNTDLLRAVQQAAIAGRVSLLGERDDIPELVAGFDIAALPSAWGEGFPNVLGEAMASGVPCVATDIGDSAWIVARTGLIVPPSDAEALAEALGCLATLGPEGRQQLGAAARARVIEEFEVDEIVHRYEMLYEQATACSLVAAKA